MKTIEGFINYRNSIDSTIRGGVTMYDVKGYYKYLTESELFEYYFKKIK